MMKKEKNPFPRKGVISLGGAMEQELRTLPAEQFIRAANLAVDYLKDGIGQIITISGPYGSGKTHLIHYAMRAVCNTSASGTDMARFIQIYAKTENPDFVSLYRQLISQIGYALLREVNLRFLGLIARQELGSEEEKSKALLDELPDGRKEEIRVTYEKSKRRALEHFRTNPDIVYKYLDNLIIQPETVLDRRASDLEKIAGENFKKAFFYLDDLDLGKVAYEWFVGEDISDTDRRRLGVSGPLRTADEAKYALRLLVSLFKHAEIRLLVYIDQLERLLISHDPKASEENAGQLHSLAEFFPRENAFLALSGSDEGWEHVTRDFTSRIGPTQICIGQIKEEESLDLVKIYLQENEEYSAYKEPSDVAPFCLEGIREVLRLRGGNMRRFLQTCHDAYAKYMKKGGTIDPDLVRKVVKEEREFFDHQTVSHEISSILQRRNLRFAQQAKLMDVFQPDFVVGQTDNPSMVIEISESLFHPDEAAKALRILNLREELVKKYPKARLIVIPMGYVSREVLDYLKRAVDSCIVYEGEDFGQKFEAVLDSLVMRAEKPVPMEVTKKLNVELGTIRDSIEQLKSARQAELHAFTERLETLLRAQTEEREMGVSARRHDEWRSWLREDQERWKQREAELKAIADAERKRLQQEGETLRWRQPIFASIPYLILSGVATLWFYVMFTFTGFSEFRYVSRGPIPVALGALIMVLFYALLIHRKIFPIGFRTNEVATFSGDLTQLAVRANTSLMRRLQASRCIRNPNPLIRYFGAQVFLTKYQGHKGGLAYIQWSDKAISETWIPLYLLFLRLAAISDEPESLSDHFDSLIKANPKDPRIIYFISVSAESIPSEQPNSSLADRKSQPLLRHLGDCRYTKLLTHAILEGFLDANLVKEHHALDTVPLEKFACVYRLIGGLPAASEMLDLANQFRNSGRFWDERRESPVKLELTEDQLQMIIDALSPHQEFGLASFHDLSISNLYLRLYRFFAEIQWRLDRGDVALGP